MNTKPPILQIRRRGHDEWFVAATWPDGRSEEIPGFETESEASAWVATEFEAWLDGRLEKERADA